ncbi:uncharacterized protein LOC110831625 isoform X2 [Zootermopsis nevadensis]|uniref:uncharacterized protein LOC110831625 isoform X2 n=1 Tax=Zootermopsis nevadensis TaxID=136037 RepID=UPI000B8E7DE9|nr:uncharacterized protein LOC110831625 isoform X2 [Zootermopsis nevadensis]
MATDIETSSSSGDEELYLYNLKPPSWKQERTSVQVIDIQSPGGHGSQNPTYSTRNKANNIGKVVSSEEMDTSELQNMNSAWESCVHIQHSASDVLKKVSNGKIKSDITETASPPSVKPHVRMSDEFQNTQDVECQTVLTGELLEGLQKRQDVGSQTIGTGDVISLNLYYGNLSGCKLATTTCGPLNKGLHRYTTLNDIEKCIDVFQE